MNELGHTPWVFSLLNYIIGSVLACFSSQITSFTVSLLQKKERRVTFIQKLEHLPGVQGETLSKPWLYTVSLLQPQGYQENTLEATKKVSSPRWEPGHFAMCTTCVTHSLSMDRTAVEVCGMKVLPTHSSTITEFRHRQTLWPEGHGGQELDKCSSCQWKLN